MVASSTCGCAALEKSMKFRLKACWACKDVLPTVTEYCSASDAFRAADRMRRDGMKLMGIEAIETGSGRVISFSRLRALHYASEAAGR